MNSMFDFFALVPLQVCVAGPDTGDFVSVPFDYYYYYLGCFGD
jgi:hypothetical protein